MREVSGFYSKMKNLLFILNIAFTLVFLFVMSYSFSRLLREAITYFTGNTIIVITIYFLLFYLLYFLFIFVLKYIEGFVLENRIKQRKQKFQSWLRRLINKEIITFSFLLVGVQVIYFFLETSVNAWWVPMAVLSIIALNAWELLPNWVIPYYSRHKDLDNRQLQERLLGLTQRAGIRFSRILVYEDSRAKAVIFGFKNSMRLILSNAVLDYAFEEIEVLVAMEIAKLHKGYIWKKALIEAMGMFVTFFLVSFAFFPACEKFGMEFIFDVETLPVLLGVFFVVFTVVWFSLNYFKRDMDKENDVYTLRLSKAPEAFVSLIIRETQANIQKDRAIYFFEKMLCAETQVSQRLMLAQDYAQNMLFEDTHRK
ncbi:MAG: M48 family metalloprotease [Candidatus Omnitrophica bacterium]|nr:M48 family metalloprotease [Candidatus Omnitrophota bacterium]